MKRFYKRGITFLFGSTIPIMLAQGLCPAVYAGDYLGAATVLSQVEARLASNASIAKTNEQTKLRNDLAAFGQTVTNLAPADAAKAWLELVDRAIKIQQGSSRNYDPSAIPLDAGALFEALPPPPDWPQLASAIAARPPVKGNGEISEIGLRLLAATLTGDAEGRKREMLNLQAKAKTAGPEALILYRGLLEQLSQAMLAMSNDPDAVLKSLDYQLEMAGASDQDRPLNVPNLIPQIGLEKATAFLRQALVAPHVLLQFQAQNETSRLAQKLAMELLPQLKVPQWGLVNSLDAAGLYEALSKQFPAPTNSTASLPLPGLVQGIHDLPDLSQNSGYTGNFRNQAQIYYMLGLISQGRAKDAVAIAKKFNRQNDSYVINEAFNSMQRYGYTAELDDFFHELLSQNPDLAFWDQYVQLAANDGQTDRMLELVRKVIGGNDLSESRKASLKQILCKALLAADQVDEAVSEMRQVIATGAAGGSSDNIYDTTYNAGQFGSLLARIGSLLHKPEWIDEGVRAATNWLATADSQRYAGVETGGVLGSVVQTLLENQRGTKAESLLEDALVHARRFADSQQQQYYFGDPPARQILTDLAMVYHQAGRYQDVLDLLEQSPAWGAGDLSDLFEVSCSEEEFFINSLHKGSSPQPVLYFAADSLRATGHQDQARKIASALLDRFPGLDRGYEVLIALDGTNAIPRLDQLFARDQFEERPLIWKAHLLKQENRLEEAEKIIRQAISIDPSDGEEGRGDRMRAYAELADVLEARGNSKDADSFRQIVKAIRMSEDADQYYSVGMLKRAVVMYEEALGYFSDAYCIQSRLAIQLAALGQNKEAEEHYLRAYELMPDSFGRVESHCFGCEKVFDGERAQSLAEKVFTQLAVERPDKPQVHYLLGYLRFEQERYNEARTNFLTAVKLDPDYLNAWVKLQETGEQTLVPPSERDSIVFNILKLDPLGRHAQPNLSRVSDLAGLWKAVAAAASLRPGPAADLFALPASKAALEKKKSESPGRSMEYEMMRRYQMDRTSTTPAGAIAQTSMVQLAGQMIIGEYNSMSE